MTELMKRSSFLIISLFSVVLSLVIISELPTPSSAASDTTSTPAETSAVTVATTSPVVPTEEAPRVPAAVPVQVTIAPSPVSVVEGPVVPSALSIPSSSIQAPIVPVGVNAKGEMAVPNGSTNNVGWYKDGVVPGGVGSAVLDAHVFAAFENLHTVVAGDSVYVRMSDGSTLHFVVRSTKLALLTELTPDMLFQQTDGRHLNLITCAGKLTPDHSTYDHRFIVYTELVN
jgi:LPXTG-site transpeptidase (sortase) family protein